MVRASCIEHVALYVSEEQCALLILGMNKDREWRALAKVWEGQGLPAIDPQTGARYWPAVRAWLDRRHGLCRDPTSAPDGVEKPWIATRHRAS
jgi:hypothetical protein